MFALAEEHPGAQIIIVADVHDGPATIIQQRYPTIQLRENAALQDVLWGTGVTFSPQRKLDPIEQDAAEAYVSFRTSSGFLSSLSAINFEWRR